MKIGYALAFMTFALATLCTQSASAAASASLSKVVIDAGHGGRDPGATVGSVREKDINLAIALKLGALISRYYPDVQVVYTRKSDVEVDLNNRGALANKTGANLFISIHTNSAKGAAPSGSETYVMGLDKTGKSLDVAMRENDVIIYEENYTTKYQGYEPGSSDSFIIFNLMQYSYLEQSLSLASLIEKQYQQMGMLPSRGVRQGPFLVLWHPAMPSLLTEVGFINNETDHKIITSSDGQENIARAIFNAFSLYKIRVEGKGQPITLAAKGGRDVPPTAVTTSSAPSDFTTQPAQNPAPQALASPPEPEPAPVNLPVPTVNNSGITFAVQICASSLRLSPGNHIIRPYGPDVYEYKEDNLYRYYIGRFNSYYEALPLRDKVRNTAKDAFVVALRDGRKIPLAEARRLTEK